MVRRGLQIQRYRGYLKVKGGRVQGPNYSQLVINYPRRHIVGIINVKRSDGLGLSSFLDASHFVRFFGRIVRQQVHLTTVSVPCNRYSELLLPAV